MDNQYEVDYCKIGSAKKTMLAKCVGLFVDKLKSKKKKSKCEKCGKPVVNLYAFPLENFQPNRWKWNKKDKSDGVEMNGFLHKSILITTPTDPLSTITIEALEEINR